LADFDEHEQAKLFAYINIIGIYKFYIYVLDVFNPDQNRDHSWNFPGTTQPRHGPP
jgi:hypothetical protein